MQRAWDDMAGNVFEWVDDWYADYTASNLRDNPSTESRLFRGGSIYETSDALTTTRRFASTPTARREPKQPLNLISLHFRHDIGIVCALIRVRVCKGNRHENSAG